MKELKFVHFGVVLTLFMLVFGIAQAADKPTIITVFGDSLTAGYGLPADDAFPAKLQKALEAKGHLIKVINAGVSGDTTAQGLARLDWTLSEKTDGVILELGANDALRGMPTELARKNLDTIIKRLKDKNIPVFLAGMLAPPNMGADYADKFNAIYPDLAKTYELPLYPFFLDGALTHTELMQADAIHPNAKGVDVIVERILPMVEAFVKSLKR